MTCNELLNEPGMILDECSLVAPAGDKPSDKVPTLVQDEIQFNLIDVLA